MRCFPFAFCFYAPLAVTEDADLGHAVGLALGADELGTVGIIVFFQSAAVDQPRRGQTI